MRLGKQRAQKKILQEYPEFQDKRMKSMEAQKQRRESKSWKEIEVEKLIKKKSSDLSVA